MYIKSIFDDFLKITSKNSSLSKYNTRNDGYFLKNHQKYFLYTPKCAELIFALGVWRKNIKNLPYTKKMLIFHQKPPYIIKLISFDLFIPKLSNFNSL